MGGSVVGYSTTQHVRAHVSFDNRVADLPMSSLRNLARQLVLPNLENRWRFRKLRYGENVIRHGDAATHMFIVVSGAVLWDVPDAPSVPGYSSSQRTKLLGIGAAFGRTKGKGNRQRQRYGQRKEYGQSRTYLANVAARHCTCFLVRIYWSFG